MKKPQAGHLGKLGQLRTLREFRVPSSEGIEVGIEVNENRLVGGKIGATCLTRIADK